MQMIRKEDNREYYSLRSSSSSKLSITFSSETWPDKELSVSFIDDSNEALVGEWGGEMVMAVV